MSGEITQGIYSNIWKSINKSIEQNNIDSFNVLKSFIYKVINLSIQQRSLKHFNEYINFPVIIYNISYSKYIKNASIEELNLNCSQSSSRTLKEVIIYNLNFHYEQNNKNLKELEILNKYYYSTFSSFGQLLYSMLKNIDFKQFKYAIEEFEQISDNENLFNLKYQIQSLNKTKDIDQKNLIKEYNIRKEFSTYRRHTLLGIKYWITFLFQVGKLDEKTTLDFLNLIKIHYYESEDVLSDILFFRSNSAYRYLNWENWDYKERRSGKAYSPPSPSDWLTIGFLIDQIQSYTLFINLESYTPNEFSQAEFLLVKLEEYKIFLLNDYENWKEILKIDSKEDLEIKINKIISNISILKRVHKEHNELIIANSPLSQEKINNFKTIIGNAWKSQARINHLFKEIGSVELITDPETKLKEIGQNIFYEKAKMMFIDGEHFQQIYGMDQIGGIIGKYEDNLFLNLVLKTNKSNISGTNLFEVLDKGIIELKNKNIKPTLIIIPSDYKYRSLSSHEKFISKNEKKFHIENLNSDFIGTYDNIPIFQTMSNALKNKIVICDFKRAFKMKFKTNPNWVFNYLNVEVNEISQEKALDKLSENPNKWKITDDRIELSNEDALTLIKTSVIIDIWSTLDFEILSEEAFIIGNIQSRKIE